jgi:molybdopterin synthase catalytic subunit
MDAAPPETMPIGAVGSGSPAVTASAAGDRASPSTTAAGSQTREACGDGAVDALGLRLELRTAPFAPLEELARWEEVLLERLGTLPAAEHHFIGRVRGIRGDGAAVETLELEHYPGMTEACITAMARASADRHGVEAVLVLHRVGRLAPGEVIVLVAVAADRRGACLRCGQEVLEDLKHHAPFWKREWSDGQGVWLTGNTPF